MGFESADVQFNCSGIRHRRDLHDRVGWSLANLANDRDARGVNGLESDPPEARLGADSLSSIVQNVNCQQSNGVCGVALEDKRQTLLIGGRGWIDHHLVL